MHVDQNVRKILLLKRSRYFSDSPDVLAMKLDGIADDE